MAEVIRDSEIYGEAHLEEEEEFKELHEITQVIDILRGLHNAKNFGKPDWSKYKLKELRRAMTLITDAHKHNRKIRSLAIKLERQLKRKRGAKKFALEERYSLGTSKNIEKALDTVGRQLKKYYLMYKSPYDDPNKESRWFNELPDIVHHLEIIKHMSSI